MCGVRPAMQRTQDQVDGCPVWLEKPSGTWKPHSACKLTGDFNYSLASASNSVPSSPCTNVPMVCPRCPSTPAPFVVCTYQFEEHWEDRHVGIDMPPELKAKVGLAVHEREWLQIAGLEKGKQAKKHTIPGCGCGGK